MRFLCYVTFKNWQLHAQIKQLFLSQSQLVNLSTMSSSHVFVLWNAQFEMNVRSLFESNGNSFDQSFGWSCKKNKTGKIYGKKRTHYQAHLTQSKVAIKWKWYISGRCQFIRISKCPVCEREKKNDTNFERWTPKKYNKQVLFWFVPFEMCCYFFFLSLFDLTI